MASMTDVKCKCGKSFKARTADVARGWGKSCSKSCAKKTKVRQSVLIPMILRAERRSHITIIGECDGCGYNTETVNGLCSSCEDDADRNGDHDQSWDAHK